MKYLLTGGSGFIGSHLISLILKNDENEVVVIDDLSTGNISNIMPFQDNPRFKFVEGTVLDEVLVNSLVKDSDLVFHLAAAVGVRYIVKNPLKTLKININGTENLLKSCSNFSKKMVLFSTSEVYGKNSNEFFSEDDDRIMGSTAIPRWGYATSKALDEFLALAYHREKNLPVVIIRLFNTVGTRQASRYGMVIPRFIKQAIDNKPLTIYGDGNQSRCFCNVKDVVSAVYSLTQEDAANGQIFNVGNDEEVSVLELARKVILLTNSESEIKFVSYSEVYGENFEDMQRRKPSLKKIRSIIDYKPKYDLDMTIREIFENIRAE